jgi:hypothetical protein
VHTPEAALNAYDRVFADQWNASKATREVALSVLKESVPSDTGWSA